MLARYWLQPSPSVHRKRLDGSSCYWHSSYALGLSYKRLRISPKIRYTSLWNCSKAWQKKKLPQHIDLCKRKFITLSVHLCVHHCWRDPARRAGRLRLLRLLSNVGLMMPENVTVLSLKAWITQSKWTSSIQSQYPPLYTTWTGCNELEISHRQSRQWFGGFTAQTCVWYTDGAALFARSCVIDSLTELRLVTDGQTETWLSHIPR